MSTIATIKTTLADLQAKARAHDRSHNEGGEGYNPYEAKIDSALNDLRAAQMADYVARFAEIRAAWNAAVAKYAGPKGVSCADLPKIEAAAGISFVNLKSAKAIVEA